MCYVHSESHNFPVEKAIRHLEGDKSGTPHAIAVNCLIQFCGKNLKSYEVAAIAGVAECHIHPMSMVRNRGFQELIDGIARGEVSSRSAEPAVRLPREQKPDAVKESDSTNDADVSRKL